MTLAEASREINAITGSLGKEVAISMLEQGLDAISRAISTAGDVVWGILPGGETRANVRRELEIELGRVSSASWDSFFDSQPLKRMVLRAYYELGAVDEGQVYFHRVTSPSQLWTDVKESAADVANAAVPAFQWGTITLIGVGLLVLGAAIGWKRVSA